MTSAPSSGSPPPQPAVGDSNAGKRLGGCEIVAKIGQGGMGAVFKARQLSMDRLVALKVLPPRLASDEAFVQRFLREARSAGQLTHPNLINVYDCGHEGSYYYFTMELIDGRDLKQVVRDNGPLAEEQAISYVMGVAKALAAAHGRGIVHRDVKPENVLIDPAGEPRLGDLGLAKPMSGELDVTLGGTMMGTPHYIAPEQAKGETVDGRADLYSLGATLHFLLSGTPVFDGQSASAVAIKHATEAPPPIRSLRPEVSAGLERIILKLLRKSPEQRYQSAEQLLTDLEALRAGQLPLARSANSGRARPGHGRPGRPSQPRLAESAHEGGHHHRSSHRTKPPMALIAALAGVAVIVIAAAIMAFNNAAKPSSSPPTTETSPETAIADPTPASDPDPDPQEPVTAPSASQAAEMLAFAIRYLDENPTAFARTRQYMEEAQTAGRGTVVAFEVDQALEALDTAWTAHAQEQWTAIAEQITQHSDTGHYSAARSLVTAFDPELAARLDEMPAQALAGIEAAAAAEVDNRLRQIRAALANDDLDGAEAEIARLDEVDCAEAVAAVEKTAQQLTKAIAARRQELAEQATAAWRRAEKTLLDALLAGNADEARDQVRRLQRDPANRAAHLQLEAVTAVADALDDQAAERIRYLDAHLRQPITLETTSGPRSGTLLSHDERFLRVETEVTLGRDTRLVPIPVRWDDLTPAQHAAFLADWRPADAHGHIALACQALAREDAEAAAAALSAAGEDHPLAPSLAERLRVLVVGAAEYAAERSWASDIEPWIRRGELNKAQGEQLVAAVGAWRQAHGQTDVARQHRETLERLAQRGELAQIDNLLRDGGFEAGEGMFSPQREDRAHQVQITAAAAASGRAGLRVVTNQPQCWLLFTQHQMPQLRVPLTPGEIYRLSFSHRAVGQTPPFTVGAAGAPGESVSAGPAWQTASYDFIFDPNATRPHGAIWHLVFTPGGEIHLDDFVLSRRPAPVLAQQQAAGPLNAGLIAYWPCDEGQGRVLTDVIGNIRVEFEQLDWTVGRIGRAAQVSSIGVAPGARHLEGHRAFTLALWVRPTVNGTIIGQREHWNFSDGPNIAFHLHLEQALSPAGEIARIDNRMTGPEGLTQDTWHHVALVFDARRPPEQRQLIFVNGRLAVEAGRHMSRTNDKRVNETIIPLTKTRLWIGGVPGVGRPFQGAIDEIRIYNRALSPEELAQLMALGR